MRWKLISHELFQISDHNSIHFFLKWEKIFPALFEF